MGHWATATTNRFNSRKAIETGRHSSGCRRPANGLPIASTAERQLRHALTPRVTLKVCLSATNRFNSRKAIETSHMSFHSFRHYGALPIASTAERQLRQCGHADSCVFAYSTTNRFNSRKAIETPRSASTAWPRGWTTNRFNSRKAIETPRSGSHTHLYYPQLPIASTAERQLRPEAYLRFPSPEPPFAYQSLQQPKGN